MDSSKAEKESKEWTIEVIVNNMKIKCQIDTGAQANVLSNKTAKINKFSNKSCINITIFSGEKLPVIGIINVNFQYNFKKIICKFYILDMLCNNIIGLETARN